jgi:hypothetical protein
VDRGGAREPCQRQGQEEAAEEPRSPAHGGWIDSPEQGLDRRCFRQLPLSPSASRVGCSWVWSDPLAGYSWTQLQSTI